MALALALRAIPALFIHDAGFLYLHDTDSYYTLRQIEVMVNHFPQYNWFDPMTAFPEGKTIDWGPLFPFIAAIVCILTGATTRDAIFFMSGWVVPIMAMLMVPVMYFLGKQLWNRCAGLAAAGFIAIISLYYFTISSYGWTDHHLAEVLFSTVFILIYCSALRYIQKNSPDPKKSSTFIIPIIFSLGAGAALFLALLTSTTVILVVLVVALYAAVQFILDYYQGNNSDYLFFVNVILFSATAVLLLLFGIKQPGTSITSYSMGVVYVQGALIAETVVLAVVGKICAGKKWLYTVCLAVLAVGGYVLITINPLLSAVSNQALGLVFGSSAYSVGIVETLPWTLPNAWDNFNFALLLMMGGWLFLGYALIKKRESTTVFLVVWSVVLLLLTIQFQRFQYYFTVNMALLAAICVAGTFTVREEKICQYYTLVSSRIFSYQVRPADSSGDKNPVSPPRQNTKRDQRHSAANPGKMSETLKDILVIIVIIFTAAFVVISLSQDISYGQKTPEHTLSPDWIESLNWLGANSPGTGVDYYQGYKAGGFTYPAQAYGIMGVWDAGHWITVFSHRIPITNPFQDNLGGTEGTAAYFLSTNETAANGILQHFRGKYVIVDSNMAVDTFTNLVPWPGGSVDISPYIKWFMTPETGDASHLLKVHRYTDGYFQTMVARLYNFDGSMIEPGSVLYTNYVIRQVPAAGETAGDVNGFARVITRELPLNGSQIRDVQITGESGELQTQGYADLFSDKPYEPVGTVTSLQHYRLIHESENNATAIIFPESSPTILPDRKTVKIFEYVKGAHISGKGIIEVPVVTNTGRKFVYRQESANGEFVVPYSTTGNQYDVRTTGPYRIVGTSRDISVREEDVLAGNLVP